MYYICCVAFTTHSTSSLVTHFGFYEQTSASKADNESESRAPNATDSERGLGKNGFERDITVSKYRTAPYTRTEKSNIILYTRFVRLVAIFRHFQQRKRAETFIVVCNRLPFSFTLLHFYSFGMGY